MSADRAIRFGLAFCLAFAMLGTLIPAPAQAFPHSAPLQAVSPWELISAMNSLRVANGLPPLIEDPIVNAVAQGTAEIMAATLASWHIGNVSGRLQAAGYGAGSRVLATENFAVGGDGITIDVIISNYWADFDHMRPATEAQYCHVGAGAAKAANGMTYYILQAAAVAGQACEVQDWQPLDPGNDDTGAVRPSVPGIIVPVTVAEAGEDGVILHEVKPGQSFWAIAVAYKVTIRDILQWNNLPDNYKLQIGDVLHIPTEGAAGFHTPTPAGMILVATPDAGGRTIHKVAVYQNLSTIAAAYGVTVEKILRLNAWDVNWPLQIGQDLIIDGPENTATPTPRVFLPIELLTPEADGRYYHVIKEGQFLEWIARQYGVTTQDLLKWNGASAERIWYPGERLLLHITPPATLTPTPAPATATPLPSPTATATNTPTLVPTPADANSAMIQTKVQPLFENPDETRSDSETKNEAESLSTIAFFLASLLGIALNFFPNQPKTR